MDLFISPLQKINFVSLVKKWGGGNKYQDF
jgi:hypothetical protein